MVTRLPRLTIVRRKNSNIDMRILNGDVYLRGNWESLHEFWVVHKNSKSTRTKTIIEIAGKNFFDIQPPMIYKYKYIITGTLREVFEHIFYHMIQEIFFASAYRFIRKIDTHKHFTTHIYFFHTN